MPFDATPVELAPECQVLLDAAKLIRDKGLCKHDWGNARIGYCAMGAIEEIGGKYEGRALFRLVEFLGENIVTWNDAPARTAEEVAQALEAAARS